MADSTNGNSNEDARSSSSSSSEDSYDDDFLASNAGGTTTAGTAGGGSVVDREALVRKKLLENFYGRSAVERASAASAVTGGTGGGIEDDEDEDDGIGGASSDEDDDDEDDVFSDEDDDDVFRVRSSSSRRRPGKGNNNKNNNKDKKDDLDSPTFDADAHTARHVAESSIGTLLETEERLALQVRTLDSTMQTLVYENYSRFIDATDAIKSIGVNVTANEDGLVRLTSGMKSIDDKSRGVEESLGTLRDQLAEKIRVKRLLTRLDALLKLPQTLREKIREGRYRTATKSYLSASSILSKHSEGFESLRNIETECNAILEGMKLDLKRKLLNWSGRLTDGDDDVLPPGTVSEIFEVAGTLYVLLNDDSGGGNANGDGGFLDELEDGSVLNADELRTLSNAASMRLLDRLLDAHTIEVQERRFASAIGGVGVAVVDPTMSQSQSQLDSSKLGGSMSNLHNSRHQLSVAASSEPAGAALIPGDVLGGILEAATMYGLSFGADNDPVDLMEFLSEAFYTFLVHVRAVLLEESMSDTGAADIGGAVGAGDISVSGDNEGQVGEEADAAQQEVSSALAILLSSVRELATGLSQAGVSVDFSSSLVDQVVDLTENMVCRRVDQKFIRLRHSVVESCLVPFVERAISERKKALGSDSPALPAIVQIGSSTLSDVLQLVDDTIRSTLSGDGIDLRILKEAVHVSTNRFAMWLASAFEILAGGESSDPMRVIDAPPQTHDRREEFLDETLVGSEIRPSSTAVTEDPADYAAENSAVLDLIEIAHKDLLCADGSMADTVDSDFVLGIAEMCRLAQTSVADNLDQSIAAHLGGGKKKQQRSLFPSGEVPPGMESRHEIDEKTKLFQMASSRLVVLFAATRGSKMGEWLSVNLEQSSDNPSGPRSLAWDALEIAKTTSIECASLYGGYKRAGPVPKMEIDTYASFSSPLLSRNKTGLQLDVERMFKETVTIFPHPSEVLEASRNSVLFVVLKVAFRSLLEHVRMSKLSEASFRQLQVDTEFLNLLIPHYVDRDFSPNGNNNACSALSNLLDDVMLNAGERCLDGAEVDDYRQEAKEVVRRFMDGIVKDSDVAKKFIISED